MEWKDPTKELPKDREIVAALRYHWKNCWPMSAEIMFGEVESYINEEGVRMARINTCDFTGGGSYCWYFPYDGLCSDSDHILAWCYAREFKRPSFINHDKHWGSENQDQSDSLE